MNEDPQWLSTSEVMARLDIGRTTLWKLVKEGRLNQHYRGANRKSRYYLRTEVEAIAHATESILPQQGAE